MLIVIAPTLLTMGLPKTSMFTSHTSTVMAKTPHTGELEQEFISPLSGPCASCCHALAVAQPLPAAGAAPAEAATAPSKNSAPKGQNTEGNSNTSIILPE